MHDERGRCVQSPVFNFALAGVYKIAAPFLHVRGQVLAAVMVNHALGLLTIVLAVGEATAVFTEVTEEALGLPPGAIGGSCGRAVRT